MRKHIKRILAAALPSVVKPVVPEAPAKPVMTLAPERAAIVAPTIAVVNRSSVLTDSEIAPVVAAIQIQVDRDFAPAWGMPANLVFVPSTHQPEPTAWVVQLLDTSDEKGALGYHDMTNADLPVAKIFAKDDQKYGLSWTVTLSHEVLEMILDPYIDSTVFVQNSETTGDLIALEACDACEDDSFGYKINDVLVSDFVLPAFFEHNRVPHSTKFDFCGVLTEPLSIGKGGYLSIFPVNPTTKGWTQQQGAEIGARFASKNPLTSRKAKRGFKG
jgi:hypothetical protein